MSDRLTFICVVEANLAPELCPEYGAGFWLSCVQKLSPRQARRIRHTYSLHATPQGPSIARGGFGRSNGGADRDRRVLSDPVGVGTVRLRASGCVACCSDGGIAIRFDARLAVCGGTVVCGSSAIGDGLCSGAGVDVASAAVRYGVSMMICCEDGVGVCSAVRVALTFGVGARVAFWRRLGRFALLTEVGCNLFAPAST